VVSERLQRQIERLLDEADEAIRRLDWATVMDRARAVLGLDPTSADAQSYLAAAQRNIQEPVPAGSSERLPPLHPTSFAGNR